MYMTLESGNTKVLAQGGGQARLSTLLDLTSGKPAFPPVNKCYRATHGVLNDLRTQKVCDSIKKLTRVDPLQCIFVTPLSGHHRGDMACIVV